LPVPWHGPGRTFARAYGCAIAVLVILDIIAVVPDEVLIPLLLGTQQIPACFVAATSS